MPSEEIVLICGRVGSGDAVPTPGSYTAPCTKCGEQVWVALSSKTVLAGGAKIMCNHCVRPLAMEAADHGNLIVGQHAGSSLPQSLVKMLKLLGGKR